jgi:hypothetical protein
MPKVRVVTVKLPSYAKCPPGFEERITRSGKTCFKVIEAAQAPPMDDITAMFRNMGVSEKPLMVEVEDNQISDLMKAFGVMGMGRSRTRKVRRTKRNSKSRK